MTVVPDPGVLSKGVEFFRHPRARRYIIRVRPDGMVRVTIPRWGSKREAMAFAVGQRAWIEKQLARVEDGQVQPLARVPVEQEIELRRRAKRELPARLLHLADALGVVVRRVSIRSQRWRWGSCSASGHICLNWQLIAAPDWVCRYVLIHELMHLKRMDHSPAFWKLVAAACPNYDEARAWLRTNVRQI